MGLIWEILVEFADAQHVEHPLFLPRYQRRQDKVNRLVREMFLQGLSTRKMEEEIEVEPLLRVGVSTQIVTWITWTSTRS